MRSCKDPFKCLASDHLRSWSLSWRLTSPHSSSQKISRPAHVMLGSAMRRAGVCCSSIACRPLVSSCMAGRTRATLATATLYSQQLAKKSWIMTFTLTPTNTNRVVLLASSSGFAISQGCQTADHAVTGDVDCSDCVALQAFTSATTK